LIDKSYRLNIVIPMIKFFKYFIETLRADPAHTFFTSAKEDVKINLVNLIACNPFNEDFFEYAKTLIDDYKLTCDLPDDKGRIPTLAVLQSKEKNWRVMFDFLVSRTVNLE
jgi:hypothetical protein